MLNTNIIAGETEELMVNGTSLVFYNVYVLKKELTDNQLEKIFYNNNFDLIDIGEGYIKKIFNDNSVDKMHHLVVRWNIITSLPFIQVMGINGVSGQGVTPKVRHYITIYAKKIILVQSVIVFDLKNVTQYECCTLIDFPLNTDDLLKIIQAIKKKNNDSYAALSGAIKKLLNDFSNLVGEDDMFTVVADTKEAEESVGIQIWDIANLKVEDNANIIGRELEERYKLELAALLAYNNEHFSSNQLWRKQSANTVRESALSRSDVLNDHQVLVNERVCLEISQVNVPELRSISASRLNTYGYDSTSIFLWGYIQIVRENHSKCSSEASELRNKVSDFLTQENIDVNDFKSIVIEKMRLSEQMELYSRIKNSCIEERHQHFIMHGMEVTGLQSIQKDINEIFLQIKEGIDVAIATQTSNTNSEMSEVLKTMKEMSKHQAESSTKLGVIGIIFAVPAVCTLCDFIVSLNNKWNTLFWKLTVLFICLIIIISCLVFIYGKNKNKEREGKENSGDEISS